MEAAGGDHHLKCLLLLLGRDHLGHVGHLAPVLQGRSHRSVESKLLNNFEYYFLEKCDNRQREEGSMGLNVCPKTTCSFPPASENVFPLGPAIADTYTSGSLLDFFLPLLRLFFPVNFHFHFIFPCSSVFFRIFSFSIPPFYIFP
jgi:hypothetical protein